MSNDDPRETHAIERARQGDPAAYDYLAAKYLPRVAAIAFGVVRNSHDAEDLAQEAFVKAYQNIGKFRAGEPFGPWIYRIVMNASLDVARRRRRFAQEPLADAEPATRDDDASLTAAGGEITRRIDAAIDTLPEMQKIVARLHFVEEFEHREIAAMTGLSEGTIRSHLSLARRKLQETLADMQGGGRS